MATMGSHVYVTTPTNQTKPNQNGIPFTSKCMQFHCTVWLSGFFIDNTFPRLAACILVHMFTIWCCCDFNFFPSLSLALHFFPLLLCICAHQIQSRLLRNMFCCMATEVDALTDEYVFCVQLLSKLSVAAAASVSVIFKENQHRSMMKCVHFVWHSRFNASRTMLRNYSARSFSQSHLEARQCSTERPPARLTSRWQTMTTAVTTA